MEDYRGKPDASPKVWCPYCNDFILCGEAVKVMKTVYRAHPDGLYPYGFCEKHYQSLLSKKREYADVNV